MHLNLDCYGEHNVILACIELLLPLVLVEFLKYY